MRIRQLHDVAQLSPAVGDGCCSPGTGCNRPGWLVTARRETPRADVRAPVGTVHVRRNGGLLTACGESAVTWHTFFDHSFVPWSDDTCASCSRVVAAVAEGAWSVGRGRYAVPGDGAQWSVAQ